MDKSQNDGLRHQRLTIQWHDDFWISVRQQVPQLRSILGVQHSKVDLVPLLRLDGRRPFTLRRLLRCLRYRGGMRRLWRSDT